MLLKNQFLLVRVETLKCADVSAASFFQCTAGFQHLISVFVFLS